MPTINYFNSFLILLVSCSLWGRSPLYIGPDLFYRSFREIVKPPRKSEEKGWVPGFQAGYDFTALKSPYFGASIRFAEGKTTLLGSVYNSCLNRFSPFESITDNLFWAGEGRLGYTWGNDRALCSSFLGVGWHSWMRRASDRTVGYDEWYRWSYISLGLHGFWLYSAFFSGGFSLSCMRTKLADVQIRGVYSWPILLPLENRWQIEVEAPLIWTHFPYSLSWVFYYRYLPVGKSEVQRTSRGEIFVPESLTYTLGNRLEGSYAF